MLSFFCCFFFFSSRRRHTRYIGDWSSDVCSSDLLLLAFLLKTSLPSQQLFCAFSSRAVRYIVVFLAFRYYALTRHTPIYGIHGILLKCRGPHELINRFFALPWVAATAIAYRWLPPLIQRNFLLSLFLPTASAGSPP